MLWYIRLLEETSDYVDIYYSFETNESMDGIIRYNKKEDNFSTIKMSEGSSEFSNQRLLPHLYGLIDENKITTDMRVVATG